MKPEDIIWDDYHKAVDDEVIGYVEDQLNIRLPPDYIKCVKKNHGGHPVNLSFKYEHPYIGVVTSSLAELISFDLHSKYNILKIYKMLSDQIPEGIIPFGDDGGGDYMCFDYRSVNSGERPAPSVVYWSHEVEPEKSIIFLANNFTGFLELMFEVID